VPRKSALPKHELSAILVRMMESYLRIKRGRSNYVFDDVDALKQGGPSWHYMEDII
jgi:hypothetical protein